MKFSRTRGVVWQRKDLNDKVLLHGFAPIVSPGTITLIRDCNVFLLRSDNSIEYDSAYAFWSLPVPVIPMKLLRSKLKSLCRKGLLIESEVELSRHDRAVFDSICKDSSCLNETQQAVKFRRRKYKKLFRATITEKGLQLLYEEDYAAKYRIAVARRFENLPDAGGIAIGSTIIETIEKSKKNG